ncbi:MAG TPA: cytochrome c maturation protein CcmE [Nitrospiria bacterium]
MNLFYLRWFIIFFAGAVIVGFGVQRYIDEVTTITPKEALQQESGKVVRVMGTLQGGSLLRNVSPKETTFLLSGEGVELPVRYSGPPSDSLRELKTLVVIGSWNPSDQELKSQSLGLVPNYGFISAAYIVTFFPMILFLFHMERKVRLLYIEIKEAKAYKPEER